jgi:2-phosphosulfolactate phosphatase
VPDAVASGAAVSLADAQEWSSNGAAVAAAARDAVVLVGGLRNAAATARAIQVEQERRQQRTSVAVIAAGEKAADGTLRFAVEDQLGAGAVIAALTDLGIDHTAPDAAVAAEGFRALKGALRHLLTASGSARELEIGVASTARMAESGIVPASVAEAASLDSSEVVPMLRDGLFVPFV